MARARAHAGSDLNIYMQRSFCREPRVDYEFTPRVAPNSTLRDIAMKVNEKCELGSSSITSLIEWNEQGWQYDRAEWYA